MARPKHNRCHAGCSAERQTSAALFYDAARCCAAVIRRGRQPGRQLSAPLPSCAGLWEVCHEPCSAFAPDRPLSAISPKRQGPVRVWRTGPTGTEETCRPGGERTRRKFLFSLAGAGGGGGNAPARPKARPLLGLVLAHAGCPATAQTPEALGRAQKRVVARCSRPHRTVGTARAGAGREDTVKSAQRIGVSELR